MTDQGFSNSVLNVGDHVVVNAASDNTSLYGTIDDVELTGWYWVKLDHQSIQKNNERQYYRATRSELVKLREGVSHGD